MRMILYDRDVRVFLTVSDGKGEVEFITGKTSRSSRDFGSTRGLETENEDLENAGRTSWVYTSYSVSRLNDGLG